MDVSTVLSFHEKPTPVNAQKFVQTGQYYWNSGIYLFCAQDYLTELQVFRPDIYDSCSAIAECEFENSNFVRYASAVSSCPVESIDRSVMEKTDKAVVRACDLSWVDLGSWHSLFDARQRDDDGNAKVGNVFSVDSYDSYLISQSRLIGTLGIRDAIVVDTDDVLLVASKNSIDDIGQLTDQIGLNPDDGLNPSDTNQRPWGSVEILVSGKGYLVKRLSVNPGQSLSLQKHMHRSECWTVVKGKGEIICGENKSVLAQGESIYIPTQVQHRLSNYEDEVLEVIEVQLGTYLSEGDVERIEDIYNRT